MNGDILIESLKGASPLEHPDVIKLQCDAHCRDWGDIASELGRIAGARSIL